MDKEKKQIVFTPQFKGWTKPGPRISEYTCELPENETLDALSGHFKIIQLKDGHRFSTDDLLVAWFGSTNAPGARSVLDLGTGIGTVGMVAAWRMQGVPFVGIEAQETSFKCLKKSLEINELTERFEARLGDFRDEHVLKKSEYFDLILGSPPYFPVEAGVLSDHTQKQHCRFELRGNIFDYCEVASKHLNPGGIFACVFPVSPRAQFDRVLDAAIKSDLKILHFKPIIFKEGEAPLVGLFTMGRQGDYPYLESKAPVYESSPLTIRQKDGRISPEYEIIKLSIGFPP